MDKEIPVQLIAQLFIEQGAVFVDNEQIPQALKAAGWRSETRVQPVAGAYELSHLVFAPEAQAPRCIFEQKMQVEVSAKAGRGDKERLRTKVLQFSPGKSSPLLEELLARIEESKKTVEFEVRF